MTNFHVGQKVVCVNNGPLKNSKGNIWPAEELEVGRVYTVASVRPTGTGITVAEADTDDTNFFPWFNAKRFRPVVERKTSIEIFKAMLNTQRTRISA